MIRIVPLLVIILLTTTSCDYVDSFFVKKPAKIDFTLVDEYPIFPSCDSIATLEYREQCFEKTASMYLETDLLLHEFVTPLSSSEALLIHIIVDREGVVSFHSIESSVKGKEINPELKEVIIKSIENFPTLIPAKKRGNVVQSVYMIPLYIVE